MTTTGRDREPRPRVLATIEAALVNGAAQPWRTDWWAPDWRPEHYLLGASDSSVREQALAAIAALTRGCVRSDGPGGPGGPEEPEEPEEPDGDSGPGGHGASDVGSATAWSDEALVRMFCGALLSVLAVADDAPAQAAAHDGPMGVAGAGAGAARVVRGGTRRADGTRDLAQDLRAIKVARVLLGVAPESYFGALAADDGTRVWEPSGMSREQMHQHLMGRPNKKVAAPFATPIRTMTLTTRRVLASYIDTGGKNTYDAYARRDRTRIREVAAVIVELTTAVLQDGAAVAGLAAQLRGGGRGSRPADWTQGAGVTGICRVLVPIRSLTHSRMSRSVRWLPVAFVLCLVVIVAVVVSVVVSGGGGLTGVDGGEVVARPAASEPPSDGGDEARDPIPTPPAPEADGTLGAATQALRLSGTAQASNPRIGTTSTDGPVDGSIEAAPGEQLEVRMTLTNDSEVPLTGALLRLRSYANPSEGAHLVYLSVKPGDGGPEALVEGAALTVEHPAEDSCFPREFTANALGFDNGTSAAVLRPTGFEESPDGEGVALVSEYILPDVGPGVTVTFSAAVRPDEADGEPTIDGSPLEVKLAGSDEEYRTNIQAAVGDTVRLAALLHNSSCDQDDAQATVTAEVRQPADASRGYLQVFVRARLAFGTRGPTRLGPATINITGRRSATLRVVPGSSWLWAGGCDEPVVVGELPDTLFAGGVSAAVPGYEPRVGCETHARWVIVEARVVPLRRPR